MNGLFGLQSMLHKESTAEDFVQVQLEQLENMDIRDNCLATLEGMRLSEETTLSEYKTQLASNKSSNSSTPASTTSSANSSSSSSSNTDSLGNLKGANIPSYNVIKADDSIAVQRAKMAAQKKYSNFSEAFDEIMGLDSLMEATDADDADDSENSETEELAPDDKAADEELDQATKEALEDIPEGSIEEAVDFWNATEQDGTFESNTALEAELVGVDMLIPKDEYEI